jgi:ABC-type spermidine/putrescine transport system, permease component II
MSTLGGAPPSAALDGAGVREKGAGRRAKAAGRPARAMAWLRRNLVMIVALLVLVYLFVPIGYTIAFSFNNAGRSNLVWQGFTTKNWTNPCGAPEVCSALVNSLKIGLLATIAATVLGTMVAFALARHRFRGRSATTC